MLSRFYLIPERYRRTDGQTDGQTDRFAISISRVSMLTRDKNMHFFASQCSFRSWNLALHAWIDFHGCLWKLCVTVCRSGRVLSFGLFGHGAVSVPRPGPQHDERRLCFLHVLADSVISHWPAVDLVRQICWCLGWSAETSASFLRR